MSKKLTAEERKEKFEKKWPEWKLIEFNGYYEPCKVKHICGNIKYYETYFNVEKRGPTCQECVDTKKWYWDVGDVVGDLTIINRRALPNTLQEYQYKCNVCGFDCSNPVYIKGKYQDEYWVTGHSIKSIQNHGGRGCACCGSRVVQPGINDVATTDPDIIDYFYDKTEAYKWTRGSTHKVKVICPICKAEQPTKKRIDNIVHEGFDCFNCGGGISYPEKIMYFLLKEINIEFTMHKVFEWSKNVYDEFDGKFHKREYDFYIYSINTIIEMHGRQHYQNAFFIDQSDMQSISLEDQQRIDKSKQTLAESYGCNYIVIDCKNSTKEYIKNSILKSQLSNLFDLSHINWNNISRKALKGIAKLVVEDKEKHPTKSTTELANEYGVHLTTIISWLKNAGIYDVSQEHINSGIKRSYPIYSIELNKAFRTTNMASAEVGVCAKAINSSCNSSIPNKKHAGKHPETGEPLTWERWTLKQYEEWVRKNKNNLNFS